MVVEENNIGWLSISNIVDNVVGYNVQVLLKRELKSCTDFKNLKTLSLGEWCITPGFDVLAAMLRHSPNLENLFIHLDMVCVNLHTQLMSIRVF